MLTESTYKGLSGVRGNSHAPFLGGGGAAMCRCYPTGRQDNTAVVRIRAAGKRRAVAVAVAVAVAGTTTSSVTDK